MTNEILKEQLLMLGISKKEFAEKFNLSQSAVNNWSSKPIPGWVEAVIDLMWELHSCIEIEASKAPKEKIHKSLEDVYGDELKDLKEGQERISQDLKKQEALLEDYRNQALGREMRLAAKELDSHSSKKSK